MKIQLRTGKIDLNMYGFASEKIYEDRNKKALDLSDGLASTVIEIFYCLTIANLQREKKELLSFENWFDDIYDLNDGDNTIALFYKWYLEQKIAQASLLPKILEDDEDNNKKK